MTRLAEQVRISAPAIRKNTISALRALYVAATLAAHLGALLWIASRNN